MYRRRTSGQFLFFGMWSALSGNAVTGIAASISGRVAGGDVDAGTQAVVAGSIAEVGGGQYVLKMYESDTSGTSLGFLFTSSGCVPASFTVLTTNSVSGQIGILSGTRVNVWSGQLSGHPVAILSGMLSGQPVFVLSGQLSGQLVTAASGVFGTASLNSGQFTIPYSGQMSGQLLNIQTQTDKFSFTAPGNYVNATVQDFAAGALATLLTELSGLGTIAVVWSGTRVNTWDAMLVGTARSGFTSEIQLLASAPSESGALVDTGIDLVGGTGAGQSRVVVSYSGDNRNAGVDSPWTTAPDSTSIYALRGRRARLASLFHSGATVPAASGLFGTASLNSGQSVRVYSGQLSGHPVFVLSGQLSGQQVDANATVGSGIYAIASLLSGQSVSVYSGQLSGQEVNLHSGNLVALVSGTRANTWSGQQWLASGAYATEIPLGVLRRSVSGIESTIPIAALGTVVLKQTSRFNAASGTTYRFDGTTVHMTQTPTRDTTMQPVRELGVGQ